MMTKTTAAAHRHLGPSIVLVVLVLTGVFQKRRPRPQLGGGRPPDHRPAEVAGGSVGQLVSCGGLRRFVCPHRHAADPSAAVQQCHCSGLRSADTYRRLILFVLSLHFVLAVCSRRSRRYGRRPTNRRAGVSLCGCAVCRFSPHPRAADLRPQPQRPRVPTQMRRARGEGVQAALGIAAAS